MRWLWMSFDIWLGEEFIQAIDFCTHSINLFEQSVPLNVPRLVLSFESPDVLFQQIVFSL